MIALGTSSLTWSSTMKVWREISKTRKSLLFENMVFHKQTFKEVGVSSRDNNMIYGMIWYGMLWYGMV